jgi:hypothetical protein
VRYRLLSNGVRSPLGGIVLGLYGARRMPDPPLAFAGILLAMQTLPVLNQLVAIALAGLEKRTAQRLKRVGGFLLGGLVLVLVCLAMLVAAWEHWALPHQALPSKAPYRLLSFCTASLCRCRCSMSHPYTRWPPRSTR